MNSLQKTSIFDIVSCEELLQLEPEKVRRIDWLPIVEVAIPPVSRGQKDPPPFPHKCFPENDWHTRSYDLLNGFCYEFDDAVVHKELGIITIGRFLVRESLNFVFPDFHGFRLIDDRQLEMPLVDVLNEVDFALHALCGYVGNRNYAHWWIDIMSVVGEHLTFGLGQGASILLPSIRTKYQTQTLDFVPEIAKSSIFIGENEAVYCRKLQYVPRLGASDYTPHPRSLQFIRNIQESLGIKPRPEKLIYISRKDAAARKLRNEDEICDQLQRLGFGIYTMSDMDVKDQIALFSTAHTLISPHGAGLANMIFCAPWTRINELHYDKSINWSLRRLSSIVPGSYGCAVGHQDVRDSGQDQNSAQNNEWFLPIERLLDTVQG